VAKIELYFAIEVGFVLQLAVFYFNGGKGYGIARDFFGNNNGECFGGLCVGSVPE
jgi:hypothetical protein